ncbi:MAG: hypothetical protein OES28_01395 [Desulfobulbaceae bacterium]|jgi:hypothetical protein|nr:hypothetical protein [Desulfobulbaceae bacterium]HKJ15576.1 hypothetical protein [Desulfobulbales bacterium]MDH3541725.1 hypothetical protein [Desulfobulbaceae bacterium]MDH3782698.1 hypothetical protein [Desulfobulbaceae bacterium]MDH3866024.1 hypothetical protein [Desulfobulbaceae bacterium]
MKNTYWLILTILTLSLGFAGGYAVSAHTGTEPGYFGAVEAAGYGGAAEEKIEGLSDEIQDYYKTLGK